MRQELCPTRPKFISRREQYLHAPTKVHLPYEHKLTSLNFPGLGLQNFIHRSFSNPMQNAIINFLLVWVFLQGERVGLFLTKSFSSYKNQCPSKSVRPLGLYKCALHTGEMRSTARDTPGWDRDITSLGLNEVRQDNNLDDALRKQQMVWKEEKGGWRCTAFLLRDHQGCPSTSSNPWMSSAHPGSRSPGAF